MTTRRIAIDAHMVGTHETGNETYVRGLVSGLRAIDTGEAKFDAVELRAIR